MNARQKWNLSILNSKDFANFVMANLKYFEKFYVLKILKKLTFSLWEKSNKFSHKVNFFYYFQYPRYFDICSINAA